MTKSTHTAQYQRLVAILANARRENGMTQQQVADRLGKPQSYIAKVEGKERRIDIVEFISLARALGADPFDLFKTSLKEIDAIKDFP